MKKICIVLIGIEIILVSLLLFNLANNMSTNELLYKNTTKLSLLLNQEEGKIISPNKQADFMDALALKYNVAFYKYIFKNDQAITIYATDPTKDQQLTLLDGQFPEKKSNQKITNFSDQSKETVGRFLWTNTNFQISLKSFSKITETGIDGIYYVGSTDKQKIRAIIKELQQSLGEVEQYDHFNQQQYFLTSLFTNPILIVSLLVVLVVNLFVYSYYIIQNSKKIAIYQLHGLTTFMKLKELLKPVLYSTLSFSLIAYVCILFYTTLLYGGFYANQLFLNGLFVTIGLLLLLFFSTALLILVIQRKHVNLANSIKGKKPLNVIISLNSGIKLFFIVIILLAISQTAKTTVSLTAELNSEKYWNKTQDIYKTELRFITQDVDKYRPYELKLKKFYEAAEQKGLFLIDVENYDILSTGEYLYEANTQSLAEQFTTAGGRSVTINMNYLAYNPIKKENNELVTEKDIVRSTNMLNLLVPANLKDSEKAITTNFLDDFQFKKNVMDSVSKREELAINIIYVKPQQNYFTFNPYIQLENQNSVLDPIAIVDTNNVDPSFYGSWLTSSVFFKAKNVDGYLYILPSIKETDTLANIQSVKSIYNEKIDTINQLKQQLFYLKLSILILFMVLLLNCISFFSAYFEKNKHLFSIKRVFGYSYLKMLLPFFVFTSLMDLLISLIVMLTLNNYSLLFPVIFILFMQGILLCGCCLVLNKKVSVILSKGELE
ncbi:hypothetical protein GIX45_23275 [Erwinia sp. CPCC 100877]|nr:hypothetical protein [Erwinia sp. CPCC 100877]